MTETPNARMTQKLRRPASKQHAKHRRPLRVRSKHANVEDQEEDEVRRRRRRGGKKERRQKELRKRRKKQRNESTPEPSNPEETATAGSTPGSAQHQTATAGRPRIRSLHRRVAPKPSNREKKQRWVDPRTVHESPRRVVPRPITSKAGSTPDIANNDTAGSPKADHKRKQSQVDPRQCTTRKTSNGG
ncbi:MAG: hypothetical protein L6R35_006514 [Caloplaca aegaea]|nr:MAG: hypothetical protein L6R35_006514 [Caloplaca aegaea]